MRRMTGAPPAIVSDRLRTFCQLGVLQNVLVGPNSARSEYRLTDKGRAFPPHLMVMLGWGDKWFRAPEGPARILIAPGGIRYPRPCRRGTDVQSAVKLFELGSGFEDPLLAKRRLADFTAPIGPYTYVEVLAPTAEDHPVARWLEKVGGASGWVLSTQVPSLAGIRERAAGHGIRIAVTSRAYGRLEWHRGGPRLSVSMRRPQLVAARRSASRAGPSGSCRRRAGTALSQSTYT
jgi:hypothetical protein